MKNKYRVILPVVLPLALAISVLYLARSRLDTSAEYRAYLQAAQEYAEKGVVSEAVASYQAAIGLQPRLETYLALGELYLNEQEYRTAANWYEDELLAAYPNAPETYAFGIRVKLAQGNAKEAFEVYDLFQKRGLSSDEVEQAIHTVWYSFDLKGDYAEVKGFSNLAELAAVKIKDTWGYVNTKGSRVIGNLYQQAGNFASLAPVVDQEGEAYFIDTNGEIKLTAAYFQEQDPELSQVTQFGDIQSGLIPACDGTVWNFYDAETYQKRFGGYKAVLSVANGVGAVSADGSSWALIDQDGQQLTGFDYRGFAADNKGVICRTNAIFAQKNGAYWLLDKTGQLISETGYEDACAFNDTSLAAVQKNGRWLFVSDTGEEQDLGDFEEAKSFSSGVAAVKQGGKWGYINTAGEWIIEPQFTGAEAFFSAGCAFVETEEGRWQLLLLDRYNH